MRQGLLGEGEAGRERGEERGKEGGRDLGANNNCDGV